MRQKTMKLATATTTLVVSLALMYVTGDSLALPREFSQPVEHNSFDTPTAPVEFLALSRMFNPETQQVPFATPAAKPFEVVALSREFNPEAAKASLGIPVTAAVKTPTLAPGRDTKVQRVNIAKSSPARTASYGPTRRLEANVDRISFDIPSLAPMAFVRFCMRYGEDCKPSRMAFRPKPLVLTEARRAELVKVTREVNRAIVPQANVNGVMAEEWQISPREGDCNDYAVTKRHELLARGWPARSLLLAEVVVPSGEHHLILVVRTRDDDLVLDNLSWNVRPVSQIRYQWVRAQQASNPRFWSTVNVARATRVAMNTR